MVKERTNVKDSRMLDQQSSLGMYLPGYSTRGQGCAHIILTNAMFGIKTSNSKAD